MKCLKTKIIVIVGPTAIGKTKLSIQWAKKFGGEIINADAMQIYRQLNIGTAKVTDQETQGIPHHLLDIRDPNDAYSVAEFREDARQAIIKIVRRGHIPIIVGGSGLYLEAIIYDVSHGRQAQPNLNLRRKLEEVAEEKGKNYLWGQLREIDPLSADRIHPNNVRRVIRALEVYEETGEAFSKLQNERHERNSLYDTFIIGLNTKRQLLYDRINHRVELMIEYGLIEEVRSILAEYGKEAEALKGIGYKEWLPYFAKEQSLEQVINQIQKNSRHYAKRQLTWFRNRLPVSLWVDPILASDSLEMVNHQVADFLQGDIE